MQIDHVWSVRRTWCPWVVQCTVSLLKQFPDSYQQSLYLVQHVKVDWNGCLSARAAWGVSEQWLLKSLNVCPACGVVIFDGISSVLWSWLFSAVLFLPGEWFQLSVRAVCNGLNLSSSAVQLKLQTWVSVSAAVPVASLLLFISVTCSHHSHLLQYRPNTSFAYSAFIRKQM